MNIFERLRADGFALRFEVRNLPADHSVHRSCRRCNFREHLYAQFRIDWGRSKCFERQCEQGISRQYRDGLTELLVTRGLAASQVIVIKSRQIVVNQRIGVDKFNRTRGM